MGMITTEQTREMLGGISPQTLANYRKRDDFPIAKGTIFGRRIFFDEQQIRTWFEKSLVVRVSPEK
jgi:hypothetical protein